MASPEAVLAAAGGHDPAGTVYAIGPAARLLSTFWLLIRSTWSVRAPAPKGAHRRVASGIE